MTACLVIGGGGHGAVVVDALQRAGVAERIAVLDADPRRIGSDLLGAPVLGDDSFLAEALSQGFTHFIVGVGSTRDNRARASIYDRARGSGLTPLSVIHPAAAVAPSATIGPGCAIMAGAVINARASLGDNVIINTRAVVEHDTRVGNHVHVAPVACLLADVNVDSGAYIGAGATVRQSIWVGTGALVGAGSVVVRDLSPGARVMGVPAR